MVQVVRVVTIQFNHEWTQINTNGNRRLPDFHSAEIGSPGRDRSRGRSTLSSVLPIRVPGNSQSFNRYSYVINNPLSLTDPSGFLFSGLRKGFGKAAPYVRIGIIIYSSYLVGNAAGNWYGGTNAAVFGGAVGGAYAAVLSRGNVIRGALTGAAFGYVGHGAGIEDEGLKMLAHGVVGGLGNRLDGQKFSQGFIAAFAGEAITLNTKGILNGFWGGLVKASVAGGIGSELGGG